MRTHQPWAFALVLGLLWGMMVILPLPLAGAEERCAELSHSTNPPGPPDSELAAAHRFSQGEGITVAVIDTGVHPHPRLGEVIGGGDLVGEGDGTEDCDRHGTIVAGIIGARPDPGHDDIVGIAPGARILSIRQTSSTHRDAAGTLASMATAINEAVDKGARVINLSVVACLSPPQNERVDHTPLDAALAHAEERDVVVVAAAGNASQGCSPGDVVYPAHADTVVGVSALTPEGRIADYSLPGPDLLAAPGHVARGLSPVGDPRPAEGILTDEGVRPWEGTSFATPVVSGIAALLRSRYPHESAAQIRHRLASSALPATGEITPLAALTHLPGPTRVEDEAARPVRLAAQPVVDTSPRRRSLQLCALLAGGGVGGWVLNGAIRSIGRRGRANPPNPTSRRHRPGR